MPPQVALPAAPAMAAARMAVCGVSPEKLIGQLIRLSEVSIVHVLNSIKVVAVCAARCFKVDLFGSAGCAN
jgi:hypothetical protein